MSFLKQYKEEVKDTASYILRIISNTADECDYEKDVFKVVVENDHTEE